MTYYLISTDGLGRATSNNKAGVDALIKVAGYRLATEEEYAAMGRRIIQDEIRQEREAAEQAGEGAEE